MPMKRKPQRCEPALLRRGKEFHWRVQADWETTVKDGSVRKEETIELSIGARPRKGRLDILVKELGDFVSVIEIKGTDWDRIKPKNVKKNLGSHRRQVWRYIDKYLDVDDVDVCPGIIYPTAPKTPGLKEIIEEYLNEYGCQVVWYDD